MWNVKAKMIPVKTEAIETISKSFRKYLNIVTGKHEIKEVHKKQYWALHMCFRKC